MSFASPDKLIWLLAALPVIAFYILKTRLRRRPVSTLLFWDQVFEQKRQRSLWQNLRHWLSLLLQLAFVGLLGFALADPLWNDQDDTGQDLILIVDNSASMQAVDPETGKSRLQSAIDQAVDVAAGLRSGDNIAVVTAGTHVDVLVGMSDFAPTAQDALRTIQPTDGPTRIEEAILAARRLASDASKRRIVVLTDGGLEDRQQVPEADDLVWMPIGQSQDNVAITTFQVRRSTVDPIGYSLLIQVNNFSEDEVETRLTLKLDDALVDVIPLTIASGDQYRKQIDGVSQQGGVLVAEVDFEDALKVDNVARAIVPRRPDIAVQLHLAEDSDSYYLQRVLESIPLIQVFQPDDPTFDPANGLSIYAGVVPEAIPDGPALFVDIPDNGPTMGANKIPAWQLGESIENPIVAKQDKSSPLLRHVQMQNVVLAGGRDLDVADQLGTATTLLETATGARVCIAIERPEGRLLLLTSDLDGSELPLRIAFPVMMTNAVNWFFRETGEIQPALATGQVTELAWDIAPSPEEPELTVANLVSPSQTRSIVTVENRQAKIGPLNAVGIYRLVDPGDLTDDAPDDSMDKADPSGEVIEEPQELPGQRIAVNVASVAESELSVPEMPSTERANLPPAGRSAWFYLIVFATGLIITEWVLFNRRVVA